MGKKIWGVIALLILVFTFLMIRGRNGEISGSIRSLEQTIVATTQAEVQAPAADTDSGQYGRDITVTRSGYASVDSDGCGYVYLPEADFSYVSEECESR